MEFILVNDKINFTNIVIKSDAGLDQPYNRLLRWQAAVCPEAYSANKGTS